MGAYTHCSRDVSQGGREEAEAGRGKVAAKASREGACPALAAACARCAACAAASSVRTKWCIRGVLSRPSCRR